MATQQVQKPSVSNTHKTATPSHAHKDTPSQNAPSGSESEYVAHDADRKLTPQAVIALQRTIGNQAVQRLLARHTQPRKGVIQRVKTPALSETIGWGWFEDKEKLKPVFKQTLTLLRGQLTTTKITDVGEKQACLVEVDRLINLIATDAEVTQNEMNAIVERVNKLAPATGSQPTQAEPLQGGEIGKFDTLADEAVNRIDQVVNNAPALEATFTGKTDLNEKQKTVDKAKENYAIVRAHVLKWKNGKDVKVRINRANANYGGYNTGTGDASSLMLSNKTFSDPVGEVAGTIIHEASHGAISTKDHAYMNAPYFLSLPDEHRLDNADHYKYAPEVAKGEKNPAQIGAEGQNDTQLVKDFKRAKDLAFYKANKIWNYLMWMKEVYGGKGYLDETTKKKHSKWLGLQARSSNAIHKENVQLLIDMYSSLKWYIGLEMDIVNGATANDLKMKPKTNPREIDVKGLNGKSVDQMSGAILDAMFEPLGLPPTWNINAIGMKFFKRIFLKEKDTVASTGGNKPSPLEVELYRIFGGEGK